jgi:preprotein translocase subunit SecE
MHPSKAQIKEIVFWILLIVIGFMGIVTIFNILE